MAGKRSTKALAGLTGMKPKRITGKQRAARKRNIVVARAAKKRGAHPGKGPNPQRAKKRKAQQKLMSKRGSTRDIMKGGSGKKKMTKTDKIKARKKKGLGISGKGKKTQFDKDFRDTLQGLSEGSHAFIGGSKGGKAAMKKWFTSRGKVVRKRRKMGKKTGDEYDAMILRHII